MISGKKIIALCTSRIFDYQQQIYIEQLNELLLKQGCRLLIFTLNSDLYWREDVTSPESYVFDIIPLDKLDCLILMDEKIKSRTVSEKMISRAAGHSVPVIVVDGNGSGTVRVSFDYGKGFESVVRHVIEEHHVRRPHFMAGIEGEKFSDERIEIFKKVIAENDIPLTEDMISYGGFWSGPARDIAKKMVDSGEIPEAVICANDIMAVNVCDVFTKSGVKVPEQVLITGFDGIEEAMLSSPQLTTAGCDSAELAKAVAYCVTELINGRKPEDVSVIPKLSPNESCGCKYVPDDHAVKMNGFNNKFYRYQDDIRILYDISTRMQMSNTDEQASSALNNYIAHDLCCVVESKCLESRKNYFFGEEHGSELCVFYDSYHPELHCHALGDGELVPDIKARLKSGYPLIFNALDFMSKPFGYLCYTYSNYDINFYTRTASITNTVSMGIGGYVSMNYQRYLTDKMTDELKAAAHMQENMMPAGHVKHILYELNASMTPAKNVGGDFYDFFQTDNDHLVLVMADVSGKGVPAALFMAIAKLVIHDRAMLPGTPAEVLRDVNAHISENNRMGLFITIWFGILDLTTGIVTYASAGHEYPAVKLSGGSYELVKSANLPPVGTMDEMTYEDLRLDLSKGGSLFIYTDGVTDLKNENGEHFGTERMTKLLNELDDSSPAGLIHGIDRGLREFAGDTERFDDTTMMCLKFNGIQ